MFIPLLTVILIVPADESALPRSIATDRLAVMLERAQAAKFSSGGNQRITARLETTPLFRYDDPARGYEDGAVWRLGKSGRPLAIVTTELHPKYAGGGPRLIYDVLSFSEAPFRANSPDFSWSPNESALKFQTIPEAPPPAATERQRLLQLRQLARRFSAEQIVTQEGTTNTQSLSLRLLPRNIDRYQPSKEPTSDGAMFLFVSGRMPGIILLIESKGKAWQYAAARLSAPSDLKVKLDRRTVWHVDPDFGGANEPYWAFNATIAIPK